MAFALVAMAAHASGQTGGRLRGDSLVFLPVGTSRPSADVRIEPPEVPTKTEEKEVEPRAGTGDRPQEVAPPGRPPSGGPVKQPEPGVPTQPGKWTATLYIVADLSCTATLVGPRVLLTAAHCVESAGRFKIGVVDTVNENQDPVYRYIDVACEAHPRYRPRGPWARLDYALCLLSEEFPGTLWLLEPASDRPPTANNPTRYSWKEAGVKFERLSLDPKDALYRLGDERSRLVLLAGMGCTDRNLSNGAEGIGQLSEGLSLVTHRDLLRLVAGAQHRRDSATICQGDSGGAAFRVLTADRHGPRRVIAINSTNIVIAGRVQQVSFLIKTSAPPFVEFFRSWRRRHNQPKVCGIDIEIEDRCHV